MDAIAAASASLRISVDKKAIHLLAKAFTFLGEYSLAIRVIDQIDLKCGDLRQIRCEVVEAMQLLNKENVYCDDIMKCSSKSILANWIGSIETFQTASMGRGIRATK